MTVGLDVVASILASLTRPAVDCGIRVVPERHQPVRDGIHKGENRRRRIKHGKVELFSQVSHIRRQGHGTDDPGLDKSLGALNGGVVQVRKCPGLDGQRGLYQR